MADPTPSRGSPPPALRILVVRGQNVVLDADLAKVYGVATFRLNEAVKRNRARFPADFSFRLTRAELTDLRSQSAISSSGHGGVRRPPRAFTEHGALMAANILRSARAVQMSVFVVRAFVRMRCALGANVDLARRLAALEHELKARLDSHESAIVDVLRRLLEIIDPPPQPDPPRKPIGFLKERGAEYRVARRRRHA